MLQQQEVNIEHKLRGVGLLDHPQWPVRWEEYHRGYEGQQIEKKKLGTKCHYNDFLYARSTLEELR
jgi:hypothetical protein